MFSGQFNNSVIFLCFLLGLSDTSDRSRSNQDKSTCGQQGSMSLKFFSNTEFNGESRSRYCSETMAEGGIAESNGFADAGQGDDQQGQGAKDYTNVENGAGVSQHITVNDSQNYPIYGQGDEPYSEVVTREDDTWHINHIRSPLARAMYLKIREDEKSRNDKHVYWYRVIVSRLPDELKSKFIQFDQDPGTEEFLENCQDKSNQIFTQLFYTLTRPILNIFMSQTQINGYLNRGSMFVFSKAQFEKLLKLSPYHKGGNLLDLGAGDGMVTQQMGSYFSAVYATEMSSSMVRRLQGHGYNVLGVDEWYTAGMTFDLIGCLNLLDRCDKPLSLLAQMRSVLSPGIGRILLAVVIPFKPYVEFGSKTHEPSEFIHVRGSNFEDQVSHFEKIFRQAGFEIESFSRLPYLCEGDLRHSFYVLNDAVFVLKPVEPS